MKNKEEEILDENISDELISTDVNEVNKLKSSSNITAEDKINDLLQYINQSQERFIDCDTIRRLLEA